MSLEVFGDEGDVATEGEERAFDDGWADCAEQVKEWISEKRKILQADLDATKRLLTEEKTAERWEAYTRLIQGLQALDRIAAKFPVVP